MSLWCYDCLIKSNKGKIELLNLFLIEANNICLQFLKDTSSKKERLKK
jgi:hypothetical protein